MRRTLALLAAVVLAAAATTAMPSEAGVGAPARRTVLRMRMDDAKAARFAYDASGLHNRGRIGRHVRMTGSYADWDRHPPGEGISYGRQHLIVVPDAEDGSLDPGRRNFSVQLRFRTSDGFGNMIQKGQAGTPGGQIKFQIPNGRITCMFKSPAGTATAGSGAVRVDDGRWHVVRCDRTPRSVTMYVDGARTSRISHRTSRLANDAPWTIGGKRRCDAVKVSCDYFAGDIDYVVMQKG